MEIIPSDIYDKLPEKQKEKYEACKNQGNCYAFTHYHLKEIIPPFVPC